MIYKLFLSPLVMEAWRGARRREGWVMEAWRGAEGWLGGEGSERRIVCYIVVIIID